MVNQLLGASEVETFVRGDMDNEVCECAVSILETTDTSLRLHSHAAGPQSIETSCLR